MGRIAEALRERSELEYERAVRVCVGAKYHSPTPLSVGIHLVAGDRVPLCGTCKDNLAVFVSLMTTSNGTLAWEVRREFGNRLRALGTRVWLHQTKGEADRA